MACKGKLMAMSLETAEPANWVFSEEYGKNLVNFSRILFANYVDCFIDLVVGCIVCSGFSRQLDDSSTHI